MGVGDFVSIRSSDRSTHIERLVGELRPDVTAEALASTRLFALPKPAGASDRPWWARPRIGLLVGLPSMAAFALFVLGWIWLATGVILTLILVVASHWIVAFIDRLPKSLIAIMEDQTDIGFQPTTSGFETIGVPFPHVILLTGKERHEYRVAVENQLTATLHRRWSNYLDPIVPARARVLTSRRMADDELVAFFGTGIFAPPPGERRVGRVEIVPTGQRVGTSPALPDGTPAGLYRGQSALAFSASVDLTPATVPALAGVSGRFCLRPNRDSGGNQPYTLDWEPDRRDPVPTPSREPMKEPPPGVDGAFEVMFPETSFHVHVIEDERRSRLLRAPPPEGALAIVGIIEPVVDGRPAERWWIDIDDNGQLIASAMRRVRYSIVSDDGALDVWDWSTPGSFTSYGARIDTIRIPDGSRNVITAPPGRPFGWIVPPERSTPVVYSVGQGEAFELDWLDFSGAVEDRTNHAERLGAWIQRNGHPCMFPGGDRAPGDDAVLIRVRNVADFRPAWRGEWISGMQIICHPLLLEVVN